MISPIYIIDAFTTHRFKGNPAAVVLNEKEQDSSTMQRVAAEFNLAETAFPVPQRAGETFANARVFSLRFFTPTVEVPLCGHATLSTAHVLFKEIGNPHDTLEFHAKGGVVSVRRNEKGVEMNFPAHGMKFVNLEGRTNEHNQLFDEVEAPNNLMDIIRCVIPVDIGIRSVVFTSAIHIFIVEIDKTTTKEQFLSLVPDTAAMLRLHPSEELILGVTFAPQDPVGQGFVDDEGRPYDYVSRIFAPWIGINEDPATGASQCSLGPYWSTILGKNELYAFQCFPGRGAQFNVTVGDGAHEGRVAIAGSSVTVVRGEMGL